MNPKYHADDVGLVGIAKKIAQASVPVFRGRQQSVEGARRLVIKRSTVDRGWFEHFFDILRQSQTIKKIMRILRQRLRALRFARQYIASQRQFSIGRTAKALREFR